MSKGRLRCVPNSVLHYITRRLVFGALPCVHKFAPVAGLIAYHWTAAPHPFQRPQLPSCRMRIASSAIFSLLQKQWVPLTEQKVRIGLNIFASLPYNVLRRKWIVFESIHVILISIVAIVSHCASFSVLTGIAQTEVHVDFLHSVLEQVRRDIKSWIRSKRVSACGGKMVQFTNAFCYSLRLIVVCSCMCWLFAPHTHTHISWAEAVIRIISS